MPMKLKNSAALFEINTACNMSCKHCYRDHLERDQLSLLQIKTILRKVSQAGIKYLILTGGEPFLRKDLFEILDFAVACKFIDVVINTNGILLNNPGIIANIKTRLDIISVLAVSFDGANSKTHDFIRGNGAFHTLLQTLGDVSLKQLPISINVTIGKWNFHDLEDFFRLYDELNAHDINFGIFIPMGKGHAMIEHVLTPQQCQVLIEFSQKKQAEGYNVELCSMPYANLFVKDLSGDCCGIFTRFISISARGDVLPCLLYDYTCGSLLEQSLEEILSHPVARLFRNPKQLQKSMGGRCRNCAHFKICNGGCHLLSHVLKGSAFESDPLCPIYL